MNKHFRTIASNFKTRTASDQFIIEGYFAVFDDVYNIFDGASESIAPGAFKDTLHDDIRALIDHETMYVLGRTEAGTLILSETDRGLYGIIRINPEDQDALNLYERVKRGDVDQCSIGFDILDETTESTSSGVHWTIRKVKLYEVSICTFPAYEATNVQARKKQLRDMQRESTEEMRAELREKLKRACNR